MAEAAIAVAVVAAAAAVALWLYQISVPAPADLEYSHFFGNPDMSGSDQISSGICHDLADTSTAGVRSVNYG